MLYEICKVSGKEVEATVYYDPDADSNEYFFKDLEVPDSGHIMIVAYDVGSAWITFCDSDDKDILTNLSKKWACINFLPYAVLPTSTRKYRYADDIGDNTEE